MVPSKWSPRRLEAKTTLTCVTGSSASPCSTPSGSGSAPFADEPYARAIVDRRSNDKTFENWLEEPKGEV